MTRINLWSGPRNISTALMYSFAQRSDTQVVDEPLYAHYLKTTGISHPGKEEILASQLNEGKEVIDNVILGDYPASVVFFKQMTHHLVNISLDFLGQTKNIILIRDPARVLESYHKVIDLPVLADIGIQQSYDLYHFLIKSNWPVIVLDSAVLLSDPPRVLNLLCRELEIPFEERMLQWPAGPRIEDGVWAKYWYDNVHKSTGFSPLSEGRTVLSPALESIKTEALPFYDFLKQYSIQ
jgi:hypothetical protein